MNSIRFIGLALLALCGACAADIDDSPVEVSREETQELAQANPNLALCLAVAGGPTSAKEAFCRSLPSREAAGRCWSKTRLGRIEWINWCFFEFTN